MRVSQLTREVHAERKFRKEWLAKGYEELGEGGGKLWEIYRGFRVGQRILDAKVAPNGMSVFVKIGSSV